MAVLPDQPHCQLRSGLQLPPRVVGRGGTSTGRNRRARLVLQIPNKIPHAHTERICDDLEGHYREVLFTAFDTVVVGSIQSGSQRKSILRKPLLESQFSDLFADLGLDVLQLLRLWRILPKSTLPKRREGATAHGAIRQSVLFRCGRLRYDARETRTRHGPNLSAHSERHQYAGLGFQVGCACCSRCVPHGVLAADAERSLLFQLVRQDCT